MLTVYNGVRYTGIWIIVYLILAYSLEGITDVDAMIIASIVTILFVIYERMMVLQRSSDSVVKKAVEEFKRIEQFSNNNNNNNANNNNNNDNNNNNNSNTNNIVENTSKAVTEITIDGMNKVFEINGKMYRLVEDAVTVDNTVDNIKNDNTKNDTNTVCNTCTSSDPNMKVMRSGMNGNINRNPNISKPYIRVENDTGKNHLDIDIRNAMSDKGHGSINVMVDPFTGSTKCHEKKDKDNSKKWYEYDFNPRDYHGAENLDQIKTRTGTRDDLMPNNFRYSDFNRLPPSFHKNSYEPGYSYLDPKDWYPLPPHPPVCVSSQNSNPQPVYIDDTTMNLKEWNNRIMPPDSINTDYIRDVLNSP
jgi:hypothetical protein